MNRYHLIALFFFFTTFLFSQNTIKHTVVEGESVYVIAKKYGVAEADIYEFNPKAKGALLQLKTVLIIPNKRNSAEEGVDQERHHRGVKPDLRGQPRQQ